MQDFAITFELRNDNGTNQSEATALPSSRWIEGEKHLFTPTVKFPDLKSGPYTLSFCVRTRSGEKIFIPIKTELNDGLYKLGIIRAL
jgi:hypothetical protein